MVMGRNANGLTEWKSEHGKTLKEYESNRDSISKPEDKLYENI